MLHFLLAFQLAIIPLKGYTHGDLRDTTKQYAVIHSDESASSATTLSHLKRTRKSYHYYINRRGKIYQLVDPKYKANHAGWSFYKGIKQWNDFSIGIAFANHKQSYTEAQYKSGKLLLDSLRKQYPNLKIVTHHDIAKFRGKTDPKNFKLNRLGASNGR